MTATAIDATCEDRLTFEQPIEVYGVGTKDGYRFGYLINSISIDKVFGCVTIRLENPHDRENDIVLTLDHIALSAFASGLTTANMIVLENSQPARGS